MKKWWKKFLYYYLFAYGGLAIVKLISMTYRLRFVDGEIERQVLEQDNGIVYASWHQRFFPGITLFAKRKPIAIMISQSRDGELVARIVNILGWVAVRGSSTRGGGKALREIKRLSREGCKIGHIVDGPKGPFGEIKPGLLTIAQASGKAIVPTITSGEKKWTVRSWDRFMIPKPFSRVIIRFGKPIYVPETLPEDKFEELRLHVEEEMRMLYEDTDKMWGTVPARKGPRIQASPF